MTTYIHTPLLPPCLWVVIALHLMETTNPIVLCDFSAKHSIMFKIIFEKKDVYFEFIFMFTISTILLCNLNFYQICFISTQRTPFSIYCYTNLIAMYSLTFDLSEKNNYFIFILERCLLHLKILGCSFVL